MQYILTEQEYTELKEAPEKCRAKMQNTVNCPLSKESGLLAS